MASTRVYHAIPSSGAGSPGTHYDETVYGYDSSKRQNRQVTYDAWNRLVKLEDGSGTVAQYEYDGAKRRMVKNAYTSGVLLEARHFFYTKPRRLQVVEERVGYMNYAERQMCWRVLHRELVIVLIL